MARRIIAWIGIILLLAVYALTLIFSLMDSPFAHSMFMASLYSTFFIPVMTWLFLQTVKWMQGTKEEMEEDAGLDGEASDTKK